MCNLKKRNELFKNTLFLKIILIFTLPALGILYFSTVLVYDKVESFNELGKIEKNLEFLRNTEKLLNSIQKRERNNYKLSFIKR